MSGPKSPFGYTEDKQEIPEELAALEKAYWYHKQGCSIRVSRDWLFKKTGRIISVPGLFKIFNKIDDHS